MLTFDGRSRAMCARCDPGVNREPPCVAERPMSVISTSIVTPVRTPMDSPTTASTAGVNRFSSTARSASNSDSMRRPSTRSQAFPIGNSVSESVRAASTMMKASFASVFPLPGTGPRNAVSAALAGRSTTRTSLPASAQKTTGSGSRARSRTAQWREMFPATWWAAFPRGCRRFGYDFR